MSYAFYFLKDLTKRSINIFTHFQGQNGLLVTARASGKDWINSQLLKQVMTSDKSSEIFPQYITILPSSATNEQRTAFLRRCLFLHWHPLTSQIANLGSSLLYSTQRLFSVKYLFEEAHFIA